MGYYVLNFFFFFFVFKILSLCFTFLRPLILTGDIPLCIYNLRYQTKIHIAQPVFIKSSIFMLRCTIHHKMSLWGENYEIYRKTQVGRIFVLWKTSLPQKILLLRFATLYKSPFHIAWIRNIYIYIYIYSKHLSHM